jgi:hypothetical protein
MNKLLTFLDRWRCNAFGHWYEEWDIVAELKGNSSSEYVFEDLEAKKCVRCDWTVFRFTRLLIDGRVIEMKETHGR